MSKLCEINIFSISLQRCITELKGETLSRLLLKIEEEKNLKKNEENKKKSKTTNKLNKKKQDPNT